MKSTTILLVLIVVYYIIFYYLSSYYKKQTVKENILDLVNDLKEKNDWNIKFEYQEDNKSGGYDSEDKIIKITMSNSIYGISEVFHELGHFIDFDINKVKYDLKVKIFPIFNAFNLSAWFICILYFLRIKFNVFGKYAIEVLAFVMIFSLLAILVYEIKAIIIGIKLIKNNFKKYYTKSTIFCMINSLNTYIINTTVIIFLVWNG